MSLVLMEMNGVGCIPIAEQKQKNMLRSTTPLSKSGMS